jgi:acetyl esterase/lipase
VSLQNFFLQVLIQWNQNSLRKLSPEHRFKRQRRFMAKDRSRVKAHISVQSGELASVPVEWITPKSLANVAKGPVCVYFHGGAFVMGGPNSHRDMAAQLADLAQVRLLMVDYRLAPEHPFPAALDDALAVYRALLLQGTAATQIVMGGDSAGGNITLATLQAIRDAGLPLPQAFFLFSPWLDLTNQGPSYTANARTDAMLTQQVLHDAVALYAPGRAPNDARLSPLLGSVAGLPPGLIIASTTEILLGDAQRLQQKLQAQGGQVQYRAWPKTLHAFPVFARFLPEARAALKTTAQFIRQQLERT